MTPLLDAQIALPPRLQPTGLAVQAGERIAVIGPNGSGKTSLLRLLAGVEIAGRPAPASAKTKVRIAGEQLDLLPPARRRRLLSFLPASRDVAWSIPVRDIIALGLDRADPERVRALLEALDLQAYADRPIDQLSTGERARALLARALAPQPRLLLLDEPLSNLDPAWVLRIADLLDEVAQKGAALLVSLHDLSLVGRFDRVLLLEEGRVRFDGSPAALTASDLFGDVFGIVADGPGWKLRPLAGRRSSP
jgi:iron complex transport system ATP-binding protein